MRDKAIGLLQDRVDELDEGRSPVESGDIDSTLSHVVSVMERYTNTMMAAESGGQAVLTPAEADEIADGCRLLDDIARDEASLVTGPLDRNRQHWISTGRHAVSAPVLSGFVRHAESPSPASTKPFGVGLYTSTMTGHGRSMWRTYLDSNLGSDLYPLPWSTWDLSVDQDSAVLEITSAADWAEFVQAYAHSAADMSFPDWARVARDFDGVHMTLRAVVAAQGITFRTPVGLTAAPFWDIESTLWLRWCFPSVSRGDSGPNPKWT